ncbi:hypothetical protein L1987_25221 [Smallanthus sonchifolius]|uniref:Uncharacterized protein n=1 Tax=Smallanthus sonchifolius TaxID=185202 RepID=A0ACB9IMM6_9ASTR|nr:hypothetical protein L1987_25221 [Smallanthus sonchifolius]
MYKKEFLSRLNSSYLIRKIGKITDKKKMMLITIFVGSSICVCGEEAWFIIYSDNYHVFTNYNNSDFLIINLPPLSANIETAFKFVFPKSISQTLAATGVCWRLILFRGLKGLIGFGAEEDEWVNVRENARQSKSKPRCCSHHVYKWQHRFTKRG